MSLKALVISQAVQPSEGVGLLVAEFKRKLDAFPAAFALGLLTGQALSFFYVVVEMREIRDSNAPTGGGYLPGGDIQSGGGAPCTLGSPFQL